MIETQDLTYTYSAASSPAIRDLSFRIEPGEIFGFLGPSGAGKSTTQKVLIGLLTDYLGEVRIFGNDLCNRGRDYYERIGVSFEFPNHFLKLSALENLTYFARLYSGATRDPAELLETVGLSSQEDLLVSQYSKGMKSRLSVARSLLHHPEVLFLDEPTAGLDPLNARRIKEIVRGQKEAGKTIFLTTHDMAVADELCDRVAFIVEGAIRLIDRPERLKLEHGLPRVAVEYLNGGETERREFPMQGLAEDKDFLSTLRDHQVRTIHTQEATLEDVFIKVTGRGLA